MRVLDILYDTTVDGPGFRTSIYFAGCAHKCPFCQNKQSWAFDNGTEMSIPEILEAINSKPLANVTFSGGDPLYQIEELVKLAKAIKETTNKTIWCYTGFTYEEIFENMFLSPILDFVDVIVDGPFLKALQNPDLPFRGSSNQRLIDIKKTKTQNKIVCYDLNLEPKFY